jgi:hypothetical protein
MSMNAKHTVFEGAHDGPGPEAFVPLVVPLASFGATVAIVGIVLFFRYKVQRSRQDLIETFLEKGEPIPPLLLAGRTRSRHADLRRGLVLITGAAGLSLALLFVGQGAAAGFGLIPALIGVAFLIMWKVETRSDPGPIGG